MSVFARRGGTALSSSWAEDSTKVQGPPHFDLFADAALVVAMAQQFANNPAMMWSGSSVGSGNVVTDFVHYWPLDDDLIDHGTGSALNGTLQGITGFTAAHILDGSENHTNATGGISLTGSPLTASEIQTGWTITLWAECYDTTVPGASGSSQTMLGFFADASNWIQIAQDDNTGGGAGKVFVQIDHGGTTLLQEASSSVISSNVAFHCAVTWDGSSIVLRINDSVKATGSTTHSGTTANGLMTTNGTGSHNWFGWIDDVRVYNRVLSSTELTDIFNWSGTTVTSPDNYIIVDAILLRSTMTAFLGGDGGLFADATVVTNATAWAGSAVFPGNADVIVAATQVMAGRPTLPASASVVAASTMMLRGTATLPGGAAVVAAANRFTPTSALLAGSASVVASALRFSTAVATLAGSGSLLATALRFTPATATLSAAASVVISTTQNVAAAATLTGAGSIVAGTRQLLAASTFLSGGAVVAINALRYTTAAAVLAGNADISVDMFLKGRVSANAILAGAASMTAQATQRMAVAVTLPAAGAVIVSSQRFTPARTVMPASASVLASVALLMRGAAVFAGSAAFFADATFLSRVVAGTSMMTGSSTLSAIAQRFTPTSAMLNMDSALTVQSKLSLAARAGLVASGSLSIFERQYLAAYGISVADSSLAIMETMNAAAYAEQAGDAGFFCDAEVKFLSPIQWITTLEGSAAIAQTMIGQASKSDSLIGIASSQTLQGRATKTDGLTGTATKSSKIQ